VGHYPINWSIGFLLFVCVGVIVGALFVFLAIVRLLHRLNWKRELRRRAALQRLVAAVIERTPITEAGHHRLVLRVVPENTDPYRSEPAAIALRGIALLPEKVAIHAESTGMLPVLFDAAAPHKLIVDLAALDSIDEARAEYIQFGSRVWEIVPPASAPNA
jgi:hypothetical protein